VSLSHLVVSCTPSESWRCRVQLGTDPEPDTITVQFPMLNFGTSFVPLSTVCADRDSLRKSWEVSNLGAGPPEPTPGAECGGEMSVPVVSHARVLTRQP
jgi:hypothetical protein